MFQSDHTVECCLATDHAELLTHNITESQKPLCKIKTQGVKKVHRLYGTAYLYWTTTFLKKSGY